MWVLGTLVVLTLSGLLAFLRQWRAGRLNLEPRQVGLRVTSGLIFTAIWVLLGFVSLLPDPAANVRTLAVLLAAVLFLCLALLVVGLLDARLVMVARVRAEARLAHEAAQALRERADDRG